MPSRSAPEAGVAPKPTGPIHPWLFNGLAILVSVVWAVSFVVDALPGSTYDPPVYVHGAFMIVLGAVFGVRIARGGDS